MNSLNLREVTEFAPGYLLVPTGGSVFYVHGSGASALSNLPPGMISSSDGFFTSVQLALASCRSGRGDKIICLPGHTETIGADAWSNLGSKTDIEVYCVPAGENSATFTWNAAGSTMLFDAASFRLRNARLFLAGADAAGSALTVAAPITVSAAGCAITDCVGKFGFDADQIVTVGITTTAAATRLRLERNHFIGATAAECTTFLDVIGVDGLYMADNVFEGATSAVGVGIVRFATTASLNIRCYRNAYINRKAASEAAVTGLAGCTGISHSELFHYLDNTGTTAWETSQGSMAFYNARTVNLAGEHGMLSTPVSA
jgi:hypothetical protein